MLTVWEKLCFVWDVIYSTVFGGFNEEMLDKLLKDDITELMREFGKSYPLFMWPILHERNVHLAGEGVKAWMTLK